MADTKISALSAGTAAPGDEIPVNRGGSNFKITAGDILKINGGTITADSPVLNLTQTWNNAAVTFTGLKFNVPTDSSASGSLLMDLQVGGTSKFSVSKAGDLTAARYFTGVSVTTARGDAGWTIAPSSHYAWSDNSNPTIGTLDLKLYRDQAAGTLAQQNGNNTQTFRLYGRRTDSTNDFERFHITASSTAGAAVQLGTQKGAVAGTARALELQTDGTTRLTIATNGTVTAAGNLFSNGTIKAGVSSYIQFTGRTAISSPADAVLLLQNDATTDFNRLQFGGTTSSFPALKRSSTTLQARLADDSDYCSLQGKLTTETAYTAGAPTATGYIVLYDSTGTAYKVPAEAL